MTNIRLRPFAPNGLLTENQTKMLTKWFQGDERNINQRGIAEAIGISRNKLYSSFDKNPDRPFDELQLKTVNKFIELYNEDIQQVKEQRQKEVEETKSTKKKAEQLIKKVGE